MSRVESYAASNLRYVGEAKLARLSDADLLELHRLLVHKHGAVPQALPEDKAGVIKAILELKVKIGILTKAEADAVVTEPTAAPARQAYEEEPSVEERAALQALKEEAMHAPHEEHDAQQGASEEEATKEAVRAAMEGIAQSVVRTAEKQEEDDALSQAAAEFERMFLKEEGTDPAVLAAEQEANKARANAFVQLAAAAAPPEAPAAPPPGRQHQGTGRPAHIDNQTPVLTPTDGQQIGPMTPAPPTA